MSYVSVAEADELLSYSAVWLALTTEQKENHIATAALWMNFSYEWRGCLAVCEVSGEYFGLPYTLPFSLGNEAALAMTKAEWPRKDCCTGGAVLDDDGCEIDGIPNAARAANAIAALSSVSTPLFGLPASPSDGGLTRKVIKAGPVTIERQWAEPTRGSEGQLVLTQVDAILFKIATRRGVRKGVGVMVV